MFRMISFEKGINVLGHLKTEKKEESNNSG